MKLLRVLLICLSFFIASSSVASPLRMEYSTRSAGHKLYHYDFSLSLDNHDNSWVPGEGFGWLVFGDSESSSPLADFVMDERVYPVGPWTWLDLSYGGFGAHHGPTLADVFSMWVPTAVGDTLTWSGTSAVDLAQGELLFSTLVNTYGLRANFEVADKVRGHIPEPTGIALLVLGLAALAVAHRRT